MYQKMQQEKNGSSTLNAPPPREGVKPLRVIRVIRGGFVWRELSDFSRKSGLLSGIELGKG